MLKLHGHLPILQTVAKAPYLVTITNHDNLLPELKQSRALLMRQGMRPEGFKAVLIREKHSCVQVPECDAYEVGEEYDYLNEGDIIRLGPESGSMRCLYRRNSLHNTILL